MLTTMIPTFPITSSDWAKTYRPFWNIIHFDHQVFYDVIVDTKEILYLLLHDFRVLIHACC